MSHNYFYFIYSITHINYDIEINSKYSLSRVAADEEAEEPFLRIRCDYRANTRF